MNLINQSSLDRGKFMMEYAFADRDGKSELSVPDLIGLTAAYLARGEHAADMKDKLSILLSPNLARAVSNTFEFFEDWKGRGLWTQGPAVDDLTFTNRKLNMFHPQVAARQLEISKRLATGSAFDQAF